MKFMSVECAINAWTSGKEFSHKVTRLLHCRCCGNKFERSFNIWLKAWRVIFCPSSFVLSPSSLLTCLPHRVAPSTGKLCAFICCSMTQMCFLLQYLAGWLGFQLDAVHMHQWYFIVSFAWYWWCTTSNVFSSVLRHYMWWLGLPVYPSCHCLKYGVILLLPRHVTLVTLFCDVAFVLPRRHFCSATSCLVYHIVLGLPHWACSDTSLPVLAIYHSLDMFATSLVCCPWPSGVPS